MAITNDEKETDRQGRERSTDLRSLLGSGMCQICGSTDGMYGFRKEVLDDYPQMPGEILFTLQENRGTIYIPCPMCNSGEIVPADYTEI